jgi:hypothetical protein
MHLHAHFSLFLSLQADLRKSQAAAGPPTVAELEDSADEDDDDDNNSTGGTVFHLNILLLGTSILQLSMICACTSFF